MKRLVKSIKSTAAHSVSLRLILAAVFLLAFALPLSAQTVSVQTKGGVATLYARDPLGGSFCLLEGKEGRTFQADEVRNHCSDLDFNGYSANKFSVGIEGGRVGKIIDLGTPEQLKQKYGYQETVGGGQGFASLRLEGGTVIKIRGQGPDPRRVQPIPQELTEAKPLFEEAKSSDSATVNLGHIYLVRLTDTHDRQFSLVAKILVLAYVPGESVTFRWQVL